MSKLLRYFHMVRHMRPGQLWHRLVQRSPAGVRVPEVTRHALSGAWVEPIAKPAAWLGGQRFRHLNHESDVVKWKGPDATRLWNYHLHYGESPTAEVVAWWIRENPPGAGVGWEAYPSSRRIVNWISWALGGGAGPDGMDQSLAVQAEWLSRTVERHLLGNHLLVNGKALVFAGTYLAGEAADRWRRMGLAILGAELGEQVLADGGHIERSPMYHALIVEDLLDLVNLNHAYGLGHQEWRPVAAGMLGWLRRMTHVDGRIAFFHDSAFGMAAEPSELEAYAVRLGVQAAEAELGASGYVRLEGSDCVVLFDGGAVGPSYQPAHSHSEALSLEVSARGRRQVVNSGVSTYEESAERLRQKATAAHNTVMVDGLEQTDVWGSFRVGRRARVCALATDGLSWAEAEHDGYARVGLMHWRRVEVREGGVVVTDRLTGSGVHEAVVSFHLHPEATVRVELDERLGRRDEAGTWHPEFGIAVENRVVRGAWRGACPVEFVSWLRF